MYSIYAAVLKPKVDDGVLKMATPSTPTSTAHLLPGRHVHGCLFPPISTAFFVNCTCSSSPVNFSKHSVPLVKAQNTSSPSPSDVSLVSASSSVVHSDQLLLTLIRQRKTEQAWLMYCQSTHLPNSVCLSRLVSQLSYQNTLQSLTRAQSIVRRLRQENQLNRLDGNSLGLLAVCAAKHGATLYASAIIKSMIRSGYLPHVKAWSAVVSRLAALPDDGPLEALRLFDSITRRLHRVDQDLSVNTKPDTGAFNAVLNACANLGDLVKFRQLFEKMPTYQLKPDVLTYNILIKLCARKERKDLLVFVLERIIDEGIEPCITTLHSLVAAYVGFGDLDTAEKMVQGMREKRKDLCRILRDAYTEESNEIEEDDFLTKLLPKSVDLNKLDDPPLLPKTFLPDARIYTTLMKGYMKEGRIDDVIRMLEAMRQQKENRTSLPDHVTYTTVISALVKSGSIDKTQKILDEMSHAGVPANRITYNVLLKGYCETLQIKEAKELARDMEQMGIKLDVVSYNILIDGCVLVDDSVGALAYFNKMRELGIAPSKVSYTTLMKAFALTNQPKLAQEVFDEMLKDPRIRVDIIAWNMLVEGYCRLGLVEEAKKIVQKMKESGFYPDVATYGSLANGIALARKPGEALLLWNEIKERCGSSNNGNESPSTLSLPSPPPLKPDEGLLDTIADVCVRAAFFKKALEIVACMEEHGISPNKTKFKRIYIEMHSRMFTSKHASQARQDRRNERKRAAEAFKFWLGLPNTYYGSEWRLEPMDGNE